LSLSRKKKRSPTRKVDAEEEEGARSSRWKTRTRRPRAAQTIFPISATMRRRSISATMTTTPSSPTRKKRTTTSPT